MIDENYMLRAIELAKRGWGYTDPNPAVGAVIVKNGKVIGEGYHHKCGDLHAEREAFAALTEPADGAEMYVTLEPCCHHGRQPPCTEAIIENGIARVIVGSRDPNPLVSGEGCRQLREQGIEVIEDFMKEECDELNPVFFHFIQTNRPYVVMKYAMTIDGKIATRTGASKWVTGEKAREHVHRTRARYSAIMAGIGTVLSDDPMLNVRIEGEEHHQPVRIIADSRLRIPLDSQIVRSADRYRTVIAYGAHADEEKKNELRKAGAELLFCPDGKGRVDLSRIIEWMSEEKLDSLLIEGGGTVHEAAVRAGIVDHVMAYVAPKIFGGKDAKTPVEGLGVELPSDSLRMSFSGMTELDGDILLEYDVIKE